MRTDTKGNLMDLAALLAAVKDGDTTAIHALSADELKGLADAILDDYKTVYPDSTNPATPEVAARLGELVGALNAVKEAQATQADARSATSELEAAIADRAAADTPDDPEPPATDDGDTGGEPPADPVLEGELLDADAPLAPELATAGRVDLSRVGRAQRTAARRPAVKGGVREKFEITVATNVPGKSSGTVIKSQQELAETVMARMAAMPRKGSKESARSGIAVIKRSLPESHYVTGNDTEQAAIIDAVADETRLPGGSLIAANGWCGPSEVDYNLCDSLVSRDGFVDLPPIIINRGGIRYPMGWDYQSLAAMLTGQIICEPDMQAGVTKECIEAPCPTWAETRLCVVPLCVTNDILQERSWPEGVRRFTQDVLDAQAHMMNSWVIQQAIATGDPATPMTPVRSGTWHAVLDQLGLLVAWYRDLYRMADYATLEVWLPRWLRQVLVSDKAKQVNGNTDIAEQQVDEFFARRGARVQWLVGWQNLAIPTGTPPNVVFNPPAGWPETVTAFMYPAGTYLRANREILSLDAIYDSVNLSQNKYIGVWAEDEAAVVKRCYRSTLVDIPICPNGAMGPMVDICATP